MCIHKIFINLLTNYKLFVYTFIMKKSLKQILEDENIKICIFADKISATSQQVCNWFSRGNIPKNYIEPIAKELDMDIKDAINLKAS